MAREKKISQNPAIAKDELLVKLGFREMIDITKLEYNEGQIEGIPKNPRYLKNEDGEKLKKSLTDSPEFLEYKPLMVYAISNDKYVTICGNMRLRIAKELRADGHSEFDLLPCVVLNADTPIEKIKEYAIKDNVQAGNWDWDELANGDWQVDELQDWGVDCMFLRHDDAENLDDFFEEVENGEGKKEKKIEIKVIIPEEEEDTKDAIKQLVEDALVEYPNVKVE
jgi:hypothetical protein